MPWNPTPEVAAARDYAKKFVKDQVIIVSLNLADQQISVVTYGETVSLCRAAKELGKAAEAAVLLAYTHQDYT